MLLSEVINPRKNTADGDGWLQSFPINFIQPTKLVDEA